MQVASGVLLLILSMWPADSVASVIAFDVLCAFGIVFFSALWVDLYSTLNPILAAFVNAVSVFFAEALIYLVEFDPLDRVFVVMLVIPFLTGVTYRLAKGSTGGRDGGEVPVEVPKGILHPWPLKVMAFVAACSFAYGVISTSTNGLVTRHAALVPAAIVMLFVLINTKRFSISILYRLAFPLMVCGFLLMALAPDILQPFPTIMLYAGFSSVEMLLLLMVCSMSYSTGASAFWLFGLLTCTQFFARQVGVSLERMAGMYLDASGVTAVIVVAVILLIITSWLIMSEKSLFSIWKGFANDTADEGDGYIKIRLDNVRTAYSLTDREAEVLYLLVQGRTNEDIAKNMFISIGTVKTHVYHIYQKVGVHTRAELMTFINV